MRGRRANLNAIGDAKGQSYPAKPILPYLAYKSQKNRTPQHIMMRGLRGIKP